MKSESLSGQIEKAVVPAVAGQIAKSVTLVMCGSVGTLAVWWWADAGRPVWRALIQSVSPKTMLLTVLFLVGSNLFTLLVLLIQWWQTRVPKEKFDPELGLFRERGTGLPICTPCKCNGHIVPLTSTPDGMRCSNCQEQLFQMVTTKT